MRTRACVYNIVDSGRRLERNTRVIFLIAPLFSLRINSHYPLSTGLYPPVGENEPFYNRQLTGRSSFRATDWFTGIITNGIGRYHYVYVTRIVVTEYICIKSIVNNNKVLETEQKQ